MTSMRLALLALTLLAFTVVAGTADAHYVVDHPAGLPVCAVNDEMILDGVRTLNPFSVVFGVASPC